ncbi:MAG: TetR/AcrR family transcriptional regulator, partial [Pseudomonadota bacterium]
PSPRTKSREDRIADIVAAALEAFSERGFERTRMEDIAARAHISKGTVYLYFKSKEDVFEGMVRHFILPNVEKAEQLSLLQDMSAEDQLKLFMKIGYTQITKPTTRKITRLIIAEGLRFPHLIEFYYENAIKRAKTAMSFILEQGRQKGEFRDLGAPLCPQVIVCPILFGSLL